MHQVYEEKDVGQNCFSSKKAVTNQTHQAILMQASRRLITFESIMSTVFNSFNYPKWELQMILRLSGRTTECKAVKPSVDRSGMDCGSSSVVRRQISAVRNCKNPLRAIPR